MEREERVEKRTETRVRERGRERKRRNKTGRREVEAESWGATAHWLLPAE